MKHRCPWCGEYVKSPGDRYFKVKKCPYCNNKYTNYTKSFVNTVFINPYLAVVISISFLAIFGLISMVPYFVIMGVLLVVGFFLPSMPFEKESNDYVDELQNKAEIIFYSAAESGLKYIRIIVKNKEVFPICFVDENNKPLSPMIYVSTEDIKWQERECNCTMNFLQYGNIDKEYRPGTRFYIFYNNKKIGEGTLGEKCG